MSVAVPVPVIDPAIGNNAPPRHIDLETAALDRYARSWIDVQQVRKALGQRELPEKIVDGFAIAEKQLSALLSRTLRQHVLWPWLSQFPGLGGAHTALIIGRIGDPRRYPGQRCSEGHYLPVLYEVGACCPIVASSNVIDRPGGDGEDIRDAKLRGIEEARVADNPLTGDAPAVLGASIACQGVMFPPRPGTGVRSLWHWAGLHVTEDGVAPRKRKGHQATWEPRVRASVMQPGGIAEQIVRSNVPHYADLYRATKARLVLRVADEADVSERGDGDMGDGGAKAGLAEEVRAFDLAGGHTERTAVRPPDVGGADGRPLRLFEADRIARKVAAKAFLGDLLVTWKSLV